ncbi:unnamed protein product [Lampetra planeri]
MVAAAPTPLVEVSDDLEARFQIYDSHLGNLWLEIAEFAGNEEKGDCSIRLLNISRNLDPVLKCHVYCYHCGTDDWKVEREVKLNVTAAGYRITQPLRNDRKCRKLGSVLRGGDSESDAESAPLSL